MEYPPPHAVLYEALDDRAMRTLWDTYKAAHRDAEYSEIDAAILNSIDEFSAWFEQWIQARSGARVRLLLIWHAHCLSAACQQMLRRSLEKRSFRCRVWFHTEEPGALQPAILSRCLVRILVPSPRPPVKIVGPTLDLAPWKDPLTYEMELRRSVEK